MEGHFLTCLCKNSVIDEHLELPYSILSPFLSFHCIYLSFLYSSLQKLGLRSGGKEQNRRNATMYFWEHLNPSSREFIYYTVTATLSRFILLEENPRESQTHSDWLQFEIKSEWPEAVKRYFFFPCFWKSTRCKFKFLISSTDWDKIFQLVFCY